MVLYMIDNRVVMLCAGEIIKITPVIPSAKHSFVEDQHIEDWTIDITLYKYIHNIFVDMTTSL